MCLKSGAAGVAGGAGGGMESLEQVPYHETWAPNVVAWKMRDIFTGEGAGAIFVMKAAEAKRYAVAGISPARLIPSQHTAVVEDIRNYAKRVKTLPPEMYPQAVMKDGKIYLQDHRRAAAMLYAGDKEVKVRLYVHEGQAFASKATVAKYVKEQGLGLK